ncbi:4-(cytidine 5'-diphospho)-2-C-methyl-D-erythritol kinase [Microtetraspora sp. AC03309]|uniref:4-(cytidine 5'-diphospho)-2-C-methyl-D-erythritol kinase n=1 Tax=Microtetraspora sp. AC03309 TaxID=2779376 RepID=UPI001E5247D4|nr:4-(cytidine 5'-diphospho)-2-C-methyl-D-erythritol kinase [Microtetraspora sp. AC03309]MCC5580202.1 4-(cytidine 5'-diphospho)-2-C-methyl-D-erythritol kinase [Microtetraspora sp. AC03309]
MTASQRATARVTVRVPAKVNLQLAVGPLRDDGYHDLVNVFHAVSLFDELTATEPGAAGTFTVGVEGESAAHVPADGTNLAVRAAEALAKHAGQAAPDGHPYGAALLIRKAIPVAGGMAGGSADAAAALVACDALWGLGLSLGELMEIGAGIGSDVPFALLGGTAVGTGRGERLTPVPVTGSFHWVFALADGGLSTPQVYGECDRLRATAGDEVAWPSASEPLMAALRDGDARELGAALVNDLQPAALALRPSLARTLDAGRDAGALGAIVSGSGPTCAFLAGSAEHARELSAALAGTGACRAAVTAEGPVPGAEIVS